jgi:hypothetical protein
MDSPADNAPPLELQRLSQWTPKPLRWLWAGRLALGKLAMLDGDPAQGKSLIALDLCARLSTGRPMPDGSSGPGVAATLILQGEDSAEDIVLPRLRALGADLDHVFGWRWREGAESVSHFPAHLHFLDQALEETGARLVVIDPVMAFLDRSVAGNSDQGVRSVLSPLARLADRHGAAVLLVRHLNKSGGRRALYRGGGSIGLLAACRSAWLVGNDPEVPGRRVLAQVKNNLATPQASLAYELRLSAEGLPVPFWLGPSPWTADQLLAAGEPAQALAPQQGRACDFLALFLSDGPRTVREIWDAAKPHGLSARTLHRARHELAIRSQKVWRDKVAVNYWLLPGQLLPGEDPALDAELEAMRHRFPPPGPLDDLEEIS